MAQSTTGAAYKRTPTFREAWRFISFQPARGYVFVHMQLPDYLQLKDSGVVACSVLFQADDVRRTGGGSRRLYSWKIRSERRHKFAAAVKWIIAYHTEVKSDIGSEKEWIE